MNDRNILIPKNFDVYEAAKFRQKVNHLISEGKKQFVFDFSNCTFIDCTGLGVLVSTYKECLELNRGFKLHSIDPQVMKVFNLTRLDMVFEIQK